MNDALLWIKHVMEQFSLATYIILVLAALLESLPIIGLFMPGAVIMVIAGVMAAEGAIELASVLFLASLGAIAGDLLGYFFGRHFSQSFHPTHRFLKPEYLTKAEAFNKRWGKLSIFLSRFIGPVRAIMSFISGMTKIPLLRFFIFSVPGTVIYFSFHVLLGYFAASAWQSIEAWSGRAGTLFLGFIVLCVVLWWLKNFFVRQGRELISISSTFFKTSFKLLINSKFWKNFSLKFPRLALVLKQRTNPGIFSGLAMSALIVAATFCLAAMTVIGFVIRNSDNFIVNFDERVRATILLFSNSNLAAVAFLITTLGSGIFIIFSSVLMLFWLWLERRHSYSIALVIATGGALLSSALLKFVFARPRPTPSFYVENLFSFPSGHATLIFAFIFFVTYYVIRVYPRWSRNVSAVLAASMLVILVGLSRVYLGVHFASDVIGGYFLGAVWLMVGIIFQHKFEQLDFARRLKKPLQIFIIVAGSLLLFGALSSQAFNRENFKDFYLSPAVIDRRIGIDLLKPGQWPATTDNVRGAKKRSVDLIIKTKIDFLRSVLLKNQWQERPQPTFSNLAQEGINFVTKKKSGAMPIRPRFWSNQTNNYIFAKTAERGDKNDLYILRLWETSDNNGATIYIAELAINRDFSIPLPPSAKIILAEARIELMKNLSQEPSFKELGSIQSFSDEGENKIIISLIAL